MATHQISIACASAFWGDTPYACRQLLKQSQLDFIAFDYLSEVTLTTLAAQKTKDSQSGFCQDFLTDVIEPHLEECLKRKIRLVSNAGAMNPLALKARIEAFAKEKGLEVKVGCVYGDDLMSHPMKPQLKTLKGEIRDFSDLASANAYFGGRGIAEALDEGADIVITGRVVDSALIAAPIVHAFHWSWVDYQKLSLASLAGHLLEGGTQVSGGNFTDWQKTFPPRDEIGFPIAVVSEDARLLITKPTGTGGLVTNGTVAEQLVFELADPSRYELPDVVCDWSRVELINQGPDVVEVTGAIGFAPGDEYKVAATRVQGYKVATQAFIGGGNARDKAQVIGDTVLFRAKRIAREMGYPEFTESRVETLGSRDECLLRISAAHSDVKPLEILSKEMAPASTSLAPGMTSLLNGRSQPTTRIAFEPLMVSKSKVPQSIAVAEQKLESPNEIAHKRNQFLPFTAPAAGYQEWIGDITGWQGKSFSQIGSPLSTFAWARSGDKGNDCNIGVIARSPEMFDLLRAELTPEKIARFFSLEFDDARHVAVQRFEMPGIRALNFVLKNCLGGGGSFSLRVDPQGKAFAQRLLELKLAVEK